MASESASINNNSRRSPAELPTLVELLIIFGVIIAVSLPFLNRPFHMDDVIFLKLAEQKQSEPLQPVLEDFVFFGQMNERFPDTHPPLVPLYLVLLMAIDSGQSEVVPHLGFIIFPMLAAVSMYFLARRFTKHALASALLLIVTPGVMVMSHGLVSDMPGLSMWLLAITMYLYGLEKRSPVLMAGCSLAITLGIFMSYQAFSVIPLLFAYAVIRKKFSLFALSPFVLPLILFAAYAAWHMRAAGFFPSFTHVSYVQGDPLTLRLISERILHILMAIAGATVFFGVMFPALLRGRRNIVFYLVILSTVWILTAIAILAGLIGVTAAILVLVLLPIAILLLFRFYAEGLRSFLDKKGQEVAQQNLFLLLWISGVLFYAVFLLPFSSVKYLLPLFPPLILLFVRLVEAGYGRTSRNTGVFLAAAVLFTATWGFIISWADYELASANRQFVQKEGRAYGELAAAGGGKLWFAGEFGFRYYMEQQGFQALYDEKQVQEGDYIIQASMAGGQSIPAELLSRSELVETIDLKGFLPVRTNNDLAEAGFYGSSWGILPFSLFTGKVEEFWVLKAVAPPGSG